MNRLEMKSDLQFKLGLLFGPLLRIAERPAEYDQQDLSEAVARYCCEYPKFFAEMRVFSESQPGHSYQVEMNRMWMGLQGVMTDICHKNASVAEIVVDWTKMARAALDAIPVPRDSAILEAGVRLRRTARFATCVRRMPPKNMLSSMGTWTTRSFTGFSGRCGRTSRSHS